jgi:hypothetical protein
MIAAPSPGVGLPAAGVSPPRELLARHALSLIPGILSRQDRDPHSPTHGCFDRRYWLHRDVDFPDGSAAECVWPLALACSLPIPGNLYRENPALKQWIEAGIRYAARSAHADGSCDAHFPFEKSPAATAGSLLACIEAYSILELNDPELLESFTRRADWLASCRRNSRDIAQLALVVLSLEKAGGLLATERWENSRAGRLKHLLALQHEEGWFPENQGADPGSHTFVVGLLAQLYRLTPSHELRLSIERAVHFAGDFVYPDGSFGGEIGSLGGSCFFPHGFEMAGEWLPEAAAVNDRFLTGLQNGLGASFSDYSIISRQSWSHLLAWQHWKRERPPAAPRPTGRHYYKKAGLLIDRRDGCELYVALNKGGVFKFWRDGKLIASDTHLSVQMQWGAQFATAVAGHVGHCKVHLDGHAIEIRGRMAFVDSGRLSTARLIWERVLMATMGRIMPGVVCRSCEKAIDRKKGPAPFRFARSLKWSNGTLRVTDGLEARKGWDVACAVGLGGSQGGSSTDASRVFQVGQLQPWQDFTEQMHQLKPGEPLKIERTF